MAFKMKAGSEGPMKKNYPAAFKKDLPGVTVTAKNPVRRVEKVLNSGYSKNSSGDLMYKGNIVPKNEASKIKDSELYTKKTVGKTSKPE
jgi:hypothetical protein|tara:strand:+ start:604 stop:870 length:267 start_codon:yes stop_codon:yes gene_type:complete